MTAEKESTTAVRTTSLSDIAIPRFTTRFRMLRMLRVNTSPRTELYNELLMRGRRFIEFITFVITRAGISFSSDCTSVTTIDRAVTLAETLKRIGLNWTSHCV